MMVSLLLAYILDIRNLLRVHINPRVYVIELSVYFLMFTLYLDKKPKASTEKSRVEPYSGYSSRLSKYSGTRSITVKSNMLVKLNLFY